MRRKSRTDKFRDDKTGWMILIFNDFLQLHARRQRPLRRRGRSPAQKRNAFCALRPVLASEMNREPPDFAKFLWPPATNGACADDVPEQLRPRRIEFRQLEMLQRRSRLRSAAAAVSGATSSGSRTPASSRSPRPPKSQSARTPLCAVARGRRIARRLIRVNEVDDETDDGGGDEGRPQNSGAPLFDLAEDPRMAPCDQPAVAAFKR